MQQAPLPRFNYGSCLAFFYREKISAPSSLVDSRRIVLTHAMRSQQSVDPFSFFCEESQNLTTAGFELTDQHLV